MWISPSGSNWRRASVARCHYCWPPWSPQRTTDGHRAYLEAVESTFGIDIDYAMLVKIYGEDPSVEKRYSPAICLGTERHVVTRQP